MCGVIQDCTTSSCWLYRSIVLICGRWFTQAKATMFTCSGTQVSNVRKEEHSSGAYGATNQEKDSARSQVRCMAALNQSQTINDHWCTLTSANYPVIQAATDADHPALSLGVKSAAT